MEGKGGGSESRARQSTAEALEGEGVKGCVLSVCVLSVGMCAECGHVCFVFACCLRGCSR